MNLKEQFTAAYDGKTVLVTGHTGFKGSWLCESLLQLGARVVGIALPPPTVPALFEQLSLATRVRHHLQDIRDRDAIARIVLETQPDFVFHLAAQALVRTSYEQPVDTYAVNLTGTVHLLAALQQLQESYLRKRGRFCAAVFVTTDKVYANREWLSSYREDDPLSGYDPYSSSKAAAELAIASFRQSFFNPGSDQQPLTVGIASARAGNVIGGGDWAVDRIVPDCMRARQQGKILLVRNPNSTRPWQHVLEPLSGYLLLAVRQRRALERQDFGRLREYCGAFNFGPPLTSNRSVAALLEEIAKHWPGAVERRSELRAPHEATLLNLATDKAFHVLGWNAVWNFDTAVEKTVHWYREIASAAETAGRHTRQQIDEYFSTGLCSPDFDQSLDSN